MKHITSLIIFFFVFFQYIELFSPFITEVSASPLPFTSAYATLSNSRLSFKGAIAGGGLSANANQVTIGSGTTAPDSVIDNLFLKDQICFNGSGSSGNGCKNSDVGTTYLVENIPGGTGSQLFSINTGLTGTMNVNDFVVSSQSGYITITFQPTQTIAVGDTIQVTIPAASSNASDGMPDQTGFDSAGFPANLLTGVNSNNGADCNLSSIKRCMNTTGSGFTLTSAILNSGAGSTHTISMISSGALSPLNTYTIAIGDTNPSNYAQGTLRFINPAPASGHTRGNADIYSVKVLTSSAGVVTNQTTTKVAPNDGVFVSANVELSITYTINDSSGGSYVGTGASACPNHINTSDTTATSVPFGSILSTNTFYNASQTHYVVTNATNGYVVTAQQDGVMSNVTGGTIVSTSCDSSCTSTTAKSWSTASNNGFGYMLNTLTGNAVVTSGTVYRQFSTTPVSIMNVTSPTSGDRFATCYRLSVSTTQQTGFYFNKLTYVATPKF